MKREEAEDDRGLDFYSSKVPFGGVDQTLT